MALEFREIGPADVARIAGAEEPQALARWSWLARAPGGWRAVCAFEGSEPLGLAVAAAQRAWVNGAEARLTELVLALETRPRRGLRKDGPLVLALRALFEAHGGAGRDLAFHGWPERGFGLARVLLGFEVVRTQTVLVHAVEPGPTALPTGVEEFPRFDHQARWLWDRCAGDFGASVVRDEAFLNWRLVEHPSTKHRLLGVRDRDGVLRGYAALARSKAVLELVDWLVPPGEPEVGAALLDAVLAVAREARAQSVRALLPDWGPWFERFQRRGFLVVDSGRFLAARTFVRKLDELWLREAWWYTPADFAALR